MKNIFTIAEKCLYHSDIIQKIQLTHHAKKLAESNQLSFQSADSVLAITKTKFPEHPLLLKPRDMPRRRLNSELGKAAFFHALAHIEFIAIYLAWDILYRFRGLPDVFYQDWLSIADEEAQHFTLIREHLHEMNVDYGDFPAHRGLWDHAEDTAADILARLAMVPRCMEARGLDVTPQMIKKFKIQDDQKSVELLTRILNDEVGHVKTGSYWFKLICEQRGLNYEEKYKELIEKYYVGKPKGPFNRELRIIAGFSNAEINWLEQRA
ncbi:MAG: ferritin-like domain-containing protein [Methylococcaceae bacterium]|nr:ferritin-like domain-containing protein [Methylococcaceae bacterium]